MYTHVKKTCSDKAFVRGKNGTNSAGMYVISSFPFVYIA